MPIRDFVTRPNALFASAMLLFTIAFIGMDIAFFFPLVVVAPLFIYWSFRRPEIWISCVILFHAVILQRTEEITIWEVLYGIYFFGFIGFWIVDHLVARSTSILREPADLFLAGFLGVSFLSGIVALASGASMIHWFRELLTMATLLVFFPAREIFRTRKGIRFVVISFLLLTMGLAIKNIMGYGTESAAVKYYFQVVTSRQSTYTQFFAITTVLSFSFWIHRFEEHRFSAVAFVAFMVAAAALIATFYRAFWIGTLIAIFLLFFFLDRSKRTLALFGLVGSLLLGALGLWIFAGNLGGAIVSVIGSRFLSSGSPLDDISFTNRLVESEAAIAAFLRSPILGHGLGASIEYFSLLSKRTYESWYIHNGYLFLLFKVGIFGTLLFFGFFGNVLVRGWKIARDQGTLHDVVHLVRGTWAALTSLLIVAVTSNVFIERESLLVIPLASAFLMSLAESPAKRPTPGVT